MSSTKRKLSEQELEMLRNLSTMQDSLYGVMIDVEKFCEGNSSAGTRVRKSMQNIKGLAQAVRVAVQDLKTTETPGGSIENHFLEVTGSSRNWDAMHSN